MAGPVSRQRDAYADTISVCRLSIEGSGDDQRVALRIRTVLRAARWLNRGPQTCTTSDPASAQVTGRPG